MSGEWLDSLARGLVRPQSAAAGAPAGAPRDEVTLSRRSIVGRGALGLVALATVGATQSASAGNRRAVACPGGSRTACYGGIDRRFKKFLTSICDASYGNSVVDWGAKFSCYAGFTDARREARRDCRRRCPKRKRPKPPNPGGSGGTTPPPPSSGPQPTCGDVTCADGDKCCKTEGGQICCAVGCRKDGNGCCSSESDCG